MHSEASEEAASGLPAVSILIVARNTGAFIGDAILSARQQTFADLEIVVIDDRSTDDTRAIAERHATLDRRVRVSSAPGEGLAAARNTSLAAARGRWCLILDSDDMLHPAHVEHLVAAARRTGAQIVAANMVNFTIRDGITRTSLFADGPGWQAEQDLDLAGYVDANGVEATGVVTGYFKPLFAVDFLRAHAITYDVRLRIAEDYDLVVRAMAAGARYVFLPRPTYFYRRHSGSTSHRLRVGDLENMLAAADTVVREDAAPAVRRAVARRKRRLRAAIRHGHAVEAAKRRRILAAIRSMGLDRYAWRAFVRSAIEGGRRRFERRAFPASVQDPAAVVLVLGDAPATTHVADPLVIHRPAPADDAARAMLADGLPTLARIVLAPGATRDDAGYLMTPVIEREAWGAIDRTAARSAAAALSRSGKPA